METAEFCLHYLINLLLMWCADQFANIFILKRYNKYVIIIHSALYDISHHYIILPTHFSFVDPSVHVLPYSSLVTFH